MGMINVEKLIGEIIDKRKEQLAAKIKRYPASNFRASDIRACDRYMVHSILDWEKKSLHDEGLQAVFDRGNEEERIVIRDLTDLGFKFIQQQTPFEIKNRAGEMICRGSIDGKILYNGEAVPVEIKSMNMNTFRSLKSLDDFRSPLHRRYISQMMMYLYGNNAEAGIFILSDLQGHYKILPVALDLGECEHIIQRLERCWEAVKAKTYPDRIDYDDTMCGRCPYLHVCLPPINNAGAKFIDNDELGQQLDRREELKPLAKEYEQIDKDIKAAFRGVSDAVVNLTWRIVGKPTEGRSTLDKSKIPEEILAAATTKEPGWKCDIIRLETKGVLK